MNTTKDMKRRRRQEAYLSFLKRKKWNQEKLLLESTSIKDMEKPRATHSH